MQIKRLFRSRSQLHQSNSTSSARMMSGLKECATFSLASASMINNEEVTREKQQRRISMKMMGRKKPLILQQSVTIIFLLLLAIISGIALLANADDNQPLRDDTAAAAAASAADTSILAEVIELRKLSSISTAEDAEDPMLSAASSDSRSTRQIISSTSSTSATATATTTTETNIINFLSPSQTDDEANLMSQSFDYHSNMPVITKRELANALKSAAINMKKMQDNQNFDSTLSVDNSNNNQMAPGSASWLANSMLHKQTFDLQALNQTQQALISEEATRILAKQYKLNRIQILRGLPLISIDQTQLGKVCSRSSRTFNCPAGKYRSLSGHCNNVQNPDWGSAHSPLVRYAPAHYIDNVSKPMKIAMKSLDASRQLSSQQQLPSARAVSIATHEAVNSKLNRTNGDELSAPSESSHMTTMMSFFGQFVFHDLVQVSQYSSQSGLKRSQIDCCSELMDPPQPNNQQQQQQQHPECMPIKFKDYCLNYMRSMAAIRSGCNLGPRDQLNLVSSYLDGSQIYGSSEEQMRRLRTFQGGRLRSQRSANIQQPQQVQLELLPSLSVLDPNQLQLSPGVNVSGGALDTNWRAAAEDCQLMMRMKNKKQQPVCFEAGDIRVNENIGLTLMHTIWMREHNLIADKLSQINRHWRDERLFEETRRIVIAELQHIIYQEFLPSIIGEEIMNRFNLSILNQGYNQNYDPTLNAGLSNELASGVLPFILSTIPSALERYSDRLEMLGSTNVADTFMDGSDLFKKNKFAQYLMGMISQNAMEPANGLANQMTKEMRPMSGSGSAAARSKRFANDEEEPPQVDILALTLQQGRDHGLKAYLYWRQVCQLKPIIRNWSDLGQIMPLKWVERLQRVYANVQQLDLYLAGALENPLPGATVGPTFVCLLARQFFHLKHGDRYWFENDLPSSSFTPEQLEQLRQTSLAKIICRNSQSTISFIQPSPMITSDPYLNAYQYCTNKAMGQLDLSKWHEPITSAQQIQDELIMDNLAGQQTGSSSSSSADTTTIGRRFIRSVLNDPEILTQTLNRAKRQLDSIAYDEIVQLRRTKRAANLMGGKTAATKHHHHHVAAGYRYLPRLKRQTLKINNQSLIFELATNEVIRSLLNQGKDRETAKSLQNDMRDFLHSLEGIQLDNLLENSAESTSLNNFISSAGNNFLTQEQRNFLLAINDQTITNGGGGAAADLSLLNTDLNTAIADVRSSSISTNCQDDDRAFPCDHTSPFRTITGWCNNLQHPKYGQSFTPLDRILPNAYEDGLSKPRQHSSNMLANVETGERLALPSARLISTTMHDDKSNLHTRYSLALMQYGQFGVDHDLTRTPFAVALDGSLLDCSHCDSKRTIHRDCLPIEIPDNDYHFNSPKARESIGQAKKCLHFVRSLNGQTGLGPRQQINALTAYIDGSNIYGSDNCEAKSLRSFVGGRLNSSIYASSINQQQQRQPKEILPVTRANPECVTPNGFCFHAGDQRASEQPGLTSIHTIFMRLHNMIVSQLSQVNKHWNDELLYQHGRRIVGAISQRITYNEFAPRLLGLDYMSKFDLLLKQVGYSDSNHYDSECSASILTEFAAAAFRMGHSLIRNAFPLLDKQYKPIGKAFQLRKAFFNSQRIMTEPNLIDTILRGIISSPIETLDNSITEELTNHLFERPKEPFSGMDLISLNIQRARDHGIGSYNNYRVKCNLTRAKTFDDLTGEIPERLVRRLKSLYASVDDIDLFPGGMSESAVHGGIIGPTFGCIIGMQLSRLKKCDRFWHETSDPYVRFSPAQLAELRKITLAKVICQNSDTIDIIQRNALDVPDNYLNPRVPCASLPSMDFSVWRENTKSCLVNNKFRIDLGASKRINPCKSCTCTLEGPICRTAKINCLQLMQQQQLGKLNFSQIMQDKSCLIQCAWLLDIQPLTATTTV